MPKSDKELTVEIVTAYVTSWNNKTSVSVLQPADVIDFIESIYKTLQSLEQTV